MKEFDRNWKTFSERSTCWFFYSVIWVTFWRQDDVTETSFAFLGEKKSENAAFVGSGFLSLGGGSLDKTFSNAKSIHLYTRKRSKISRILTIFVPKCLTLASILFQFIFVSFFLIKLSWGSDRSTRKSSFFFEFPRIIAYKISIDLVLLWCKLFMVLLPRSWIVLVFLPRSPKNFLEFFPRSWKILQNFANFAKEQLPRSWQEMSKIQEISWQENQDAKHWVYTSVLLQILRLRITTRAERLLLKSR